MEIRPVRGIGDVTPGDDLVELIAAAAPWLADGDVLVVTSKIVSKSEGRLVEVPADGPERDAARATALAAETRRVVARRGPTTIVQTHHGFVMAAAGIDASNVDKTHLVLLPADPDASARRLRDGFRARGLAVAVVVSDTMGRAWRNGLTDVALGAAGIAPFRDHRGETDPYGNELQLTQMAVIDELAAAGELVKGKCDQVPVAVVRGFLATPGASLSADVTHAAFPPPPSGLQADAGPDADAGAAALLRDAASDMFSLGTAEARAAGLLDAAQLPEEAHLPGVPVDPAAIERALTAVAGVLSHATTVTSDEVLPHNGVTTALHLATLDTSPAGLMRLGADAHRLRAALAAESIVTVALPHEDGIRLGLSGLEAPGGVQLGHSGPEAAGDARLGHTGPEAAGDARLGHTSPEAAHGARHGHTGPDAAGGARHGHTGPEAAGGARHGHSGPDAADGAA
ncbi:coenzyme F420-0:L-glutamate ligase [Actinoplanes sp. KI2]|nr:coenzyme F420-0:L-glutamate ligase [Actinoplanes sp. KI2]MCU7725372.1 coenzyme F420-0:L-glutamate ligase [Actinoplanes sp. KI2]